MSDIKKNLSYQIVYEILVLLLPLITAPYISRVLGPENVGIYSYTYTVANYFVIFSMLGLKNYGNRKIAQCRDDQKSLNKVFSEILVFHMLWTLVILVAYVVFVKSIVKDNQLYFWLSALYIVSSLFDITWFFFGIEKFKVIVLRNVIIRLLTLICIFLFIKSEHDLWLYVTIMAGGTLAGNLIVIISARQEVSFCRPSWSAMRTHIKPMIVLFAPVLAVSVYRMMDKMFLGSMSTMVQTGLYESAEKIINIPMTIITSFGTVMMPRMSNLVAKGQLEESRKYINVCIRFVMMLAFALTFGIAGIANDLAPLFFGESYAECGLLIKGLAITIPFLSFANVIRTQYIIPNERDTLFIGSLVTGAIVNVIFNSLLIPSMGALGAVVGTILAEISVCLFQVISVRRQLPIRDYIIKVLPFFIFGLIMYAVVMVIGKWMNASIWMIVIQIVVGACVYLGISTIYLLVTKDEFLRSLIRNIKVKRGKKSEKKISSDT